MFQHHHKIGVAICTPIPYTLNREGKLMKELVTVDWNRHRACLGTPTNYNTIEVFIDGKEVGEARNEAVTRCLNHKPCPKYLFFLDYDVLPQADALAKLIYRAECYPEIDIFAGVYCSKTEPAEPLIYAGDGEGPFWDWTIGDLLFNITGVHMGLTLIRLDLFNRLEHTEDNPLFLTVNDTTVKGGAVHRRRGTEDLWFCRRARTEAGAKILVDTSVLAGHIQNSTGTIYGLPNDSPPVKRAHWLHNGKEVDAEPTKKALDIGCGSYPRTWPEHKTYSTDIRKEVNPDYVMDSRQLNLPDDEFDLVASSHHFEHIGRWDQEKVWAEVFRVCKPGGKCEIVVPNLVWAAKKLIEVEDGRDDEGFMDVMNCLYGAQESHLYERDLNTHYFGYTPSIGKALAEKAGFVDVQTETWKDNPDLTLNLIIRGTKPSGSVHGIGD